MRKRIFLLMFVVLCLYALSSCASGNTSRSDGNACSCGCNNTDCVASKCQNSCESKIKDATQCDCQCGNKCGCKSQGGCNCHNNCNCKGTCNCKGNCKETSCKCGSKSCSGEKFVMNITNNKDNNVNNDKSNTKDNDIEVTDYESCVRAGGSILKTLPPKCRDPKTGKIFTKKEDIILK